MSIDPRIAARRAEVREGAARADARRLLWWMAGIAALVLVAWVAQLPAFRVQEVAVAGAERAAVTPALAEAFTEGDTPLVLVRPGRVEAVLEADPWVVDARVALRYPDTVVVELTERAPVVTVRSAGRALVVAADGVVVSDVADRSLPVAELDGVPPSAVGRAAGDVRVTGAAAFLGALPSDVARAGSLDEIGGELWFRIGSVDVRLGRAVDMPEKAAALTALLDSGTPPGATIHLVSARRPAVEVPVPAADATDEGSADEAAGDDEPGADEAESEVTP